MALYPTIGSSLDIELVGLDDFLSKDYEKYFAKLKGCRGMLWLDVEGSALSLDVTNEVLKRISIAKFESEYAKQPG